MVAKKIIFRKCDRRDFCSVKATSAAMGGDPCPGVLKYIDVIYKCGKYELFFSFCKNLFSSASQLLS